MHAFILIGNNKALLEREVNKIAQEGKVELLEFELKKIEDVRNLSSFTKLKVKTPSALLIRDIDNATTEALNAFLKNLEEPQKNLKYILTATSEYHLLPTIISRCQVVRLNSSPSKSEDSDTYKSFIDANQGEKLLFLSKIGKKEQAIEFLENLISYLLNSLKNADSDYGKISLYLKSAQRALLSINKNASVPLQLTLFAIALTGYER
jgi:DNA polymerase III delta prime subunit